MITGIIPAGGKAERWEKYPKEFLPIGNGITLLDRTVQAMNFGSATKTVLVTSPAKIQMQVNHLGRKADYVICTDGLWKSIMAAFSRESAWYLFAMPDTYFPQDVFDCREMHRSDFNMAIFETDKPDRFGIFDGEKIEDKPQLKPGKYQAWGCISWTKKVFRFWFDHISEIKNHTDAFNLAINEFGVSVKEMDYYYDMASFEDYKDFIIKTTEANWNKRNG